MEEQPDLWCRAKIFDYWTENRDKIAEFVGADPLNLTFVSNATAGTLTSLPWLPLYHGYHVTMFTMVTMLPWLSRYHGYHVTMVTGHQYRIYSGNYDAILALY